MSTASPQIQDLARRLLALEASRSTPSDERVDDAVKVCEKLRVLISKLVGVAGFASLLSRALVLARAQVPRLERVKVREDGSLEGFDTVGRDRDTRASADAGLILVGQLLGLLVTFIGQSLTLSLVRDVWPDTALDETDSSNGDRP